MNTGHYIWNRAERVDEENMPHVIVEAFNKWQKKELKSLRTMTEDFQKKTLAKVDRQKKQMQENLALLGYQVN